MGLNHRHQPLLVLPHDAAGNCRDEVEEAWTLIDPIEEAWHSKKDAPELYFYPAGSWGPEAADNLLARDGRAWRRL